MKFGHISNEAADFFSAMLAPEDQVEEAEQADVLHNPEMLAQARQKSHETYFSLTELIQFDWSWRESTIKDIPVTWIETDKVERTDKVIMHLHGGCYCYLKPVTSAAVTAPLARAAGLELVSVDYRLAPENPYPAGLDDAHAVYLGLLDDGYAPGDIVVIGESAGGGLALSLALKLRENGEPQPAALGLMSPWCDLTGQGDSYVTIQDHDFFLSWNRDMADQAKAYAGDMPLDHPAISLVFHDDFSGLPPTLIQAGTREILLSDAVIIARKMKASGCDVELALYEGMPHVWQVAVPIPEAQQAVSEMADFLLKKPR
jgi:epsilon-lactone hydrolase